ncbi:MAG: hypothetical protein AB7U61_04565 [Methylocystis sp.]
MTAEVERRLCLAAYFRLRAELEEEQARRLEAQERDAAFREVWACYRGLQTTRSKALAKDYASYLSNAWPRERELWTLPDSATTKRKALHRLARSRDGKSLSWRTIFDIATIYAADRFETASRIVRVDS